MKIVIITKSYYPHQSARALRATELAQQFAKMGYDVTVYTVIGIEECTEYTKKTGVKVKSIKTRWILSPSNQSKIRGFFIRVFSVLFSRFTEFPNIEFLSIVPKLLAKEKNVDLLITSAFPYPIHFGAARAKKKLGDAFPKTWISDCGDPFMGNDVSKPFFWFKYLELNWGKMTDYVTIPIKDAAKAYYPNVQDKIRVIPQGLDFSSIRINNNFTKNDIPHFAYSGTIFPGYRDLTSFLEFLCTVNDDFRFYVYTKDSQTIDSYKCRLKEKLVLNGYIPRTDLVYQLSQMDFLINLTNKSSIQSPSKLIDYALSKRPILDIQTPFSEHNNFISFMHRNYSMAHVVPDIQQYNIEVIANQFISLTQ